MEKIWKTWDDREIPISQMETKHLKSAIRIIERMTAKKNKLKQSDPSIDKLARQQYPEYEVLLNELASRKGQIKSTLSDQLAALRKSCN